MLWQVLKEQHMRHFRFSLQSGSVFPAFEVADFHTSVMGSAGPTTLSDNFRATGPRCTECRRFDRAVLFTQTVLWNHLGEFFQNVLICRLYPRISGLFGKLNYIRVLRMYFKALGSSGDVLSQHAQTLPQNWRIGWRPVQSSWAQTLSPE